MSAPTILIDDPLGTGRTYRTCQTAILKALDGNKVVIVCVSVVEWQHVIQPILNALCVENDVHTATRERIFFHAFGGRHNAKLRDMNDAVFVIEHTAAKMMAVNALKEVLGNG